MKVTSAVYDKEEWTIHHEDFEFLTYHLKVETYEWGTPTDSIHEHASGVMNDNNHKSMKE